MFIIPQISNSVKVFIENFPTTAASCKEWMEGVLSNNPELLDQIKNFNPDWEKVANSTISFVQENANGIIGVILSVPIVATVYEVYSNYSKELDNTVKKSKAKI